MSDVRRNRQPHEPHYLRPRVDLELARVFGLLNWLLTRDTAMRLVRSASMVADDPDLFASACALAVDEVYAYVDPTVVPLGLVANYIEWIARRVAGQEPEPPHPSRLGRIPDVPVDALYVPLDDGEADALRQMIKPGEIWVNATKLDGKAWAIVGSWVQAQRVILGQTFSRPGRKPGSGNPARDRVAVRVAQESDNKAAWKMVVEAGLRTGPLYDPANPRVYPRNRELLARLRRRGHQLSRP